MSFKKQYFKTKPFCKVTFTGPKQLAAFAQTVHLVGDFNDWNKSITPNETAQEWVLHCDTLPEARLRVRVSLST
jgi:hypothetical protein